MDHKALGRFETITSALSLLRTHSLEVPGGYDITADYTPTNTVVHVLLDTAEKILWKDKDLDLLAHAPNGRDNLGTFLPSWVPDWTSKGEDHLRSYISYLGDVSMTNERYYTQGDLEFRRHPDRETSLDLKVKGFLVDILDDDRGPVPGFPSLRVWSLAGPDERVEAVTGKAALLDDEVWARYGARLPVVLRPEGGNEYSLCGEVLLKYRDGHEPYHIDWRRMDNACRGGQGTKDIWII
jgi:hypothetical protein